MDAVLWKCKQSLCLYNCGQNSWDAIAAFYMRASCNVFFFKDMNKEENDASWTTVELVKSSILFTAICVLKEWVLMFPVLLCSCKEQIFTLMKDCDTYNGWKFKLHIQAVLCALISTELSENIC